MVIKTHRFLRHEQPRDVEFVEMCTRFVLVIIICFVNVPNMKIPSGKSENHDDEQRDNKTRIGFL
jgi:hypothetical protein